MRLIDMRSAIAGAGLVARSRIMTCAIALCACATLSAVARAQCIQGDKLTASAAAPEDWFGTGVAIDGNRAVVGAPRQSGSGIPGAAYVYEFDGTNWIETARLVPSGSVASDAFGVSVSVDGDRILVGSWAVDAAYVFELQGATWAETAKFVGETAGDHFGLSVSLSGDRALVGARFAGGGKAYVYDYDGVLWSQTAELVPSDGTGGQFGWKVSLDGDTALVGAYAADVGPSGNQGAAFIFKNDAAGWSETAKLTASDGTEYDEFGIDVAVRGSVALVGARYADGSGGAAYLFAFDGTAWSEAQKLVADVPVGGAWFGYAVALSDKALVGARHDSELGPSAGAAYVFRKTETGWVQDEKLTAADGEAGDQFSIDVALDGSTALIGAHLDDDGGSDSGAAYVFSCKGPDLSAPTPGIAGVSNTLTASNLTPNGIVGFGFGLSAGVTHVGPTCPGLAVGIDSALLVGLVVADSGGNASLSGFVPASLSGKTVFLQAGDVAACEVSNLVTHTFP